MEGATHGFVGSPSGVWGVLPSMAPMPHYVHKVHGLCWQSLAYVTMFTLGEDKDTKAILYSYIRWHKIWIATKLGIYASEQELNWEFQP